MLTGWRGRLPPRPPHMQPAARPPGGARAGTGRRGGLASRRQSIDGNPSSWTSVLLCPAPIAPGGPKWIGEGALTPPNPDGARWELRGNGSRLVPGVRSLSLAARGAQRGRRRHRRAASRAAARRGFAVAFAHVPQHQDSSPARPSRYRGGDPSGRPSVRAQGERVSRPVAGERGGLRGSRRRHRSRVSQAARLASTGRESLIPKQTKALPEARSEPKRRPDSRSSDAGCWLRLRGIAPAPS